MKARVVYGISALSVCFCLMMICLKVSLLVASIICLNIAPSKSLSTLPLAFMLLGGAVSIIPAGIIFKYFKRKLGLLFGVLLGLIGALICIWGVRNNLFWGISLGLFFLGLYSGVAQFYRFTAADISPSDFKIKAMSYVLFGGVFAAIFAPLLADTTRNLIPSAPFLATYIIIFIITIVAGVLLSFARFDAPVFKGSDEESRSLTDIVRQRNFIIATLMTSISYMVMTYVMIATPLAMEKIFFFDFSKVSVALSIHFLGMFGPSLITGRLIQRFGVKTISGLGFLLMILSAMTIFCHHEIVFFIALGCLGLGWNFSFIGGSVLLTTCYRPSETDKAQTANNLITMIFAAIGGVMSGVVLFQLGWDMLNYTGVVFSIIGFILVWYIVSAVKKA